MQLKTAAPVQVVPASSTFTPSVTIDMSASVINVFVLTPGGLLVDSQPVPAALLASLQTYLQQRAELLLGVPAGSTTIAATPAAHVAPAVVKA